MGMMGCWEGGGHREWGGTQLTGHAERPQPEVHPVEDDEAHGEVQLASVLGVALEIPGILPQTDLLDLPNVDCGERGT